MVDASKAEVSWVSVSKGHCHQPKEYISTGDISAKVSLLSHTCNQFLLDG